MLSLSLASLRHQSRQYLAPGLAVVLGIAFMAATLVLTGTMSSSIRQSVAGQYEPYASVVVARGADTIPAAVAHQVEEVAGVRAVDPVRTGSGLLRTSTGESYAMVTTESTTSPHPVLEGRAPRAATEVALSATVAAGSQLEVGDTVPVTAASGGSAGPVRATVVGILDVAGDPRYGGGTPAVFATPDGVTRLTGAKGWAEIDVVSATDEEASTAAIRTALEAKGVDVTVVTATQHADDKVTEFTGGTDFLAVFFLAFAVIALFVSAIVIANTFSILLARRARETAMLRAVGATRGQVIRSALAESLVVGVLFSVVGVITGIAMAWGLTRAGGALAGDALPDLVFTVPVRAVAVPVVVGVLVVLVAALPPVVRSSRVAPLAALRPDAAITATSRGGRVRIALGLVLVAAGAAALVVAGSLPSVLVGVVGGLVSFTGVIMAGSVLVPWAARAIGLVAARPFGPAGRLAIDNAVRNPARAAATASALLVGVTLVTMTAVGAATTRTAVTDFVNARYPVDVVVQGSAIPGATASAIRSTDGVAATATLSGTTVDASWGSSSARPMLSAVPEGLRDVVRDPTAVPTVTDGSVVVSEEAAGSSGIRPGDEVILQGPDGRTRARVTVAGDFDVAWLVTPATLAEVEHQPATTALLARFTDGADATATLDGVKELAGSIDEGQVSGAAPVRAANMQALDIALAVVLALLAISVVIAVVGIANTLSLSVIERTRESALLRALGLTRGQLRAMLAIEAVLLSLVGVVLGTALGVAYGVAGVRSLFGEFMAVSPTLPWGQLAAVALVAVLAGLLASVLPAHRATKVAPAQALAVE
ncbi:FtsX-like permease family protein [Janibacter limosus]|uniref:FtsX-like permease family protein n=1 Tax=Janibacter limosus TaxID=53458 RepID=A0A4P6MTC7_9MICO|nr:FtsX-like permease family protein [Janibacter limosus]QBF46002.1 FtsX-like permease family protein [Janibacter limosus]